MALIHNVQPSPLLFPLKKWTYLKSHFFLEKNLEILNCIPSHSQLYFNVKSNVDASGRWPILAFSFMRIPRHPSLCLCKPQLRWSQNYRDLTGHLDAPLRFTEAKTENPDHTLVNDRASWEIRKAILGLLRVLTKSWPLPSMRSGFGEINSPLCLQAPEKWSKPTTTLTGLTWEFNQGIKVPQSWQQGVIRDRKAQPLRREDYSSHRRWEGHQTAVHALRNFWFSEQR